MSKLQDESEEQMEAQRLELEDKYRQELKTAQSDWRAKRNENASVMESEVQVSGKE
jgi:hypothetical protein